MNTLIQSSVLQGGEDIPWEDASPGIKRQVYGYDDKIMLVRVKFEKSAVGSMHQHHHSQVSYVESGKFELTIGDEKKVLKQVMDFMFHQMHCMVPCVWKPGF